MTTKPYFHLKTTVLLGGGMVAEVSTIDLAVSGFGTGIETCIFYVRDGKTLESEVVAHYSSPEEAEDGHRAFCHAEVLDYILRAVETAKFLREER